MQSHSENVNPEVNREDEISPSHSEKNHGKSLNNIPTNVDDSDNQPTENPSNQLVLYKTPAEDAGLEIEPVPDSTSNKASFRNFLGPNSYSRVLPSIGAFTVQCAKCFQWRLIPTKEKYEEIREHILQDPFFCEKAQEWRPSVSCADPPDISQDGSRLWAIDKPNIAQPPPGWERLLRIRGEGSTKFADVYYAAPSGKRMRSMVEVQKYLLEHPEYTRQGVKLSQFSFQTPRPLQENYVRKRPTRLTAPSNDSIGPGIQRPLEPHEVNPLSWAGPSPSTDLQIGGPSPSTPFDEQPVSHSQQAKKKSSKKRRLFNSSLFNQPDIKVEDSPQVGNASPCEL